jgi:hypothetical protein
VDRKELEELGVDGDLRVSGVPIDSLEEVVLFVVVRRKYYVVDDSLENLITISTWFTGVGLRPGWRRTGWSLLGSFSTASV